MFMETRKSGKPLCRDLAPAGGEGGCVRQDRQVAYRKVVFDSIRQGRARLRAHSARPASLLGVYGAPREASMPTVCLAVFPYQIAAAPDGPEPPPFTTPAPGARLRADALHSSSDALYLAQAATHGRPLVVVTATAHHAQRLCRK
jgi:hypothetical protein